MRFALGVEALTLPVRGLDDAIREEHDAAAVPDRMANGRVLRVRKLSEQQARGAQLDLIRPGTPVENACIESFNGPLRDGCLNVHQFLSIEDAPQQIEAWRIDCGARRPHSALGHLTRNGCAVQPQPLAA